MIRNPPATFIIRAEGESMIQDGNLLIVDRSLQAGDGDIVVAAGTVS